MEITEMSKLNRKQIRKMLLREFKMIGLADSSAIGSAPMGMSGHGSDHGMKGDHGFAGEGMVHMGSHKGSVSKEDCCRAVLCLIECCNDMEAKSLLQECCEDILSRC